MVNESSARALGGEEDRIRAAYARRKRSRDPALSAVFNPQRLFLLQQRERHVVALLKKRGLARSLGEKKILDVGCGTGYSLREFIQWGARPENLVGIDLLPDRVAEARSLFPEAVTIRCGNAERLDLPDASFDLVHQSTVFTSIFDPALKRKIAAEMIRGLKPDGLIVWYDFSFDNPHNPDVRGVKKREIHELFRGCGISLRRTTLAPPISRRLAPYSLLLCDVLEKIPLLCSHYVGAIWKR